MSKQFWKSKVFWVNAVTLGLHYAKPHLGIDTVPDVNPEVLALANLVLRFFTNKAVTLS